MNKNYRNKCNDDESMYFENFIRNLSKKYNYMSLGGIDEYFTTHIRVKKLDMGFYGIYSQLFKSDPHSQYRIVKTGTIIQSLELNIKEITENDRIYLLEDPSFSYIEFRRITCPYCSVLINQAKSDNYNYCEHFLFQFLYDNILPVNDYYTISRMIPELMEYESEQDMRTLVTKYNKKFQNIQKFILKKYTLDYFEEFYYIKEREHFLKICY